MRVFEVIIYIACHTGWSLEYIRALAAGTFWDIYFELRYLEDTQNYYLGILKHPPERQGGNVSKKVREPLSIKLGDGSVYNCAVLNANMMENLEEEFNESFTKLVTDWRLKVVKALVHELLKPNYPDMTREQVGKLLTAPVMANLDKLVTEMMK